MNVLILQHVDIEGPGVIEDCLTKEKIPYRILNLASNPSLPNQDDLTHIILLGGPMNVYEEDRYPFLKKEDLFIKEAIQRGKKVLGICLGAQLIAKALGAKAYKAIVREVGWYNIQVTEEGSRDPLFSDLPGIFPAFQWHEDTFDLPKSAKLMATSYPVSNQAFRYGEGAYGLQFHLEVTEKMIRNWIDEYEAEKSDILLEPGKYLDAYRERGESFFSRFFSL